jgi:NRPS condensation-like uncharacterized protein
MKRGRQTRGAERPARYRAETLDQFLSFQTDNNDHHIRAVLRFDGPLDLDVLRAAVIRTLLLVPVLGSKYVGHPFGAYWEATSFENRTQDFVTLVNSSDGASDERRFLARRVDHRRGPQVLVQIIRGTGGDSLCMVVNHMVFDGTSFKRYLVTLARCYGNVVNGETGRPERSRSVGRGLRPVFDTFTLRDLVRLAFKSESGVPQEVAATLPERAAGEPRAEFNYRQIGPSQFGGVLSYAHGHCVTVNDIVMAAYCSAFWDIAQPRDGVLNVACMVDLRRYLPNDADIYANLSSMVLTRCMHFESFTRTLDEVHSAMVRAKSDTPGLSGLPLLATLDRVLPHGVFERAVKRAVTYPQISITNLGVIPDDLDFGTMSPVDAYILTALKREPAIQLTFSTFRQTLTLSMAQLATELGISRATQILDTVIRRLEDVARSGG